MIKLKSGIIFLNIAKKRNAPIRMIYGLVSFVEPRRESVSEDIYMENESEL